MPWETKEGQGALFRNAKREKDTHPNAKGEARIGGVLYYVSAWTKKDKNGNAWQSLSFKRKDEARQERKPAPNTDADGIPF